MKFSIGLSAWLCVHPPASEVYELHNIKEFLKRLLNDIVKKISSLNDFYLQYIYTNL